MIALTWHRLSPRHYTADHPTLGVVTLRDIGAAWVLYWQDPRMPHSIKGQQRTPTGKTNLRAAQAAAERTLRQFAGEVQQ